MLYPEIVRQVIEAILGLIEAGGYPGVFLLMTLESACMPVPSEIVMPFAGYLTLKGEMHIHLVAIAGTLGCQAGSLLSYILGYKYGDRAVELLVRYKLVSRHHVEKAFEWLRQHGSKTLFISRLLPAIRTVISLPAGIARVDFTTFFAYSFVGSAIWCYFLSYLGLILGENWVWVQSWVHRIGIVALGVLLIYFFYRWRKKWHVILPPSLLWLRKCRPGCSAS